MRTQREKLIFGMVAVVLSATVGCGDSRRIDYSVPSLVKTLKESEDPNMRYWAADALGKFGHAAEPAVPDLISALNDQSKMVRMGAAYALGEVGAAEALPALQTAGKDAEKDVRDA